MVTHNDIVEAVDAVADPDVELSRPPRRAVEVLGLDVAEALLDAIGDAMKVVREYGKEDAEVEWIDRVEDLEQKLEDVERERDILEGKLDDLQQEFDELTLKYEEAARILDDHNL